MGNENGEWIMHGMDVRDPRRIRTPEQLREVVDRLGFLPLFRNPIYGFSVEEMTLAEDWWSGNEKRDPWEWRRILAAEGKVAYGKFFDKKAGFISLEWLPRFVNWRRDGYDYEGWWEDGHSRNREKLIMDLFENETELYSFEIKKKAGFGKGGEKNFEGTLTDLMMKSFLTVRDFRQKRNKQMEPYGWHIAVYTTPENLWGKELIWQAEDEKPEESGKAILDHLKKIRPQATETEIKKLMKF